ncbi:MAG: hypothetical protein WA901_20375, partial [Phormidesmis sp.]
MQLCVPVINIGNHAETISSRLIYSAGIKNVHALECWGKSRRQELVKTVCLLYLQLFGKRTMAATKLSIRPVMAIWRNSLRKLLDFYAQQRGSLASFFPKLFLFFMLLNMACYWLAIIT